MLFGKLLPREGNFFEMFNQHADRIVEAARAFSQLVANYSDVNLREQYNREVDNAERAADRVTHEVNRLIHKTFITPIDREQIHTLINTMDDVCRPDPGLGRDHGAVRRAPHDRGDHAPDRSQRASAASA